MGSFLFPQVLLIFENDSHFSLVHYTFSRTIVKAVPKEKPRNMCIYELSQKKNHYIPEENPPSPDEKKLQ